MTLTADTITDDMIRALARSELTAGQHADCKLSLSARREMLTSSAGRLSYLYPTTKERRAARERCARLLNALRSRRG